MGLKEMGFQTLWPCVPEFLGKSIRSDGQEHDPDRLAQQDGINKCAFPSVGMKVQSSSQWRTGKAQLPTKLTDSYVYWTAAKRAFPLRDVVIPFAPLKPSCDSRSLQLLLHLSDHQASRSFRPTRAPKRLQFHRI
jgi:hypothetical protein